MHFNKMARLELFPDVLLIDRAYINSHLTEDINKSGGTIICRPWGGKSVKPDLFGKKDFKVNESRRGSEIVRKWSVCTLVVQKCAGTWQRCP